MKKRYFVTGIVIVVITAAGVWTFPLWHTAYFLHYMAKSNSFDCQIQVTVGKEGLSKGEEQFLQALSWILGLKEADCLEWQAKGYVSERQGYAEIYCDALKEPVTELYITKDSALVNIKMLYGILQGNFVKEHPILGHILPDWEFGTYISLDQIQEIFQVDLKEMFQKSASDKMIGQSFWKNLLLLKGMDRCKAEDGGWQFETVWNDYQIAVKTGKMSSDFEVRGISREQSRKIAEFSFLISSGEEKPIAFPDSLMTSEEIEQFQKLWSAVQGFMEGRK